MIRQGVIATAAMVMAGTALAAPPAPTGAQPAGCSLQQTGALHVEMKDYQPLVTVKINDQPVKLTASTGSFATGVTWETAQALNLSVIRGGGHGNYEIYGVGGKALMGAAKVDAFTIGGATAKNIQILVAGHDFGDGSQGQLGREFFNLNDIELDLKNGAIRFFKPKNCQGDQVVYWGAAYSVANLIPGADDEEFQVTVRVNGVPLRAAIDTGSTSTVVTIGAANRLGVQIDGPRTTHEGVLQGVGEGGEKVSSAVFQSFTFDQETIKNPRLRVADLFGAAQITEVGTRLASRLIEGPQLVLGADFLNAHRVYIARSQGKVYISYAGGPVFRPVPASDVPPQASPAAK